MQSLLFFFLISKRALGWNIRRFQGEHSSCLSQGEFSVRVKRVVFFMKVKGLESSSIFLVCGLFFKMEQVILAL